MSITVGVSVAASTSNLDRLIARLSAPSIEAVIETFANLIADETRQNAPVRSGDDKASVKVELEALAATISIGEGLKDGYGALQELGFHHHGSGTFVQNPALLPAFLAHKDAFIAAIRALVGG